MIGRLCRIGLLAAVLCMLTGCLSVQAPDRVDVRVGEQPPEDMDSSRVPATSTHAEARAELEKAYRYIAYLERRSEKLEEKSREYKEERDEYKKERDDCEDRLERYEDD